MFKNYWNLDEEKESVLTFDGTDHCVKCGAERTSHWDDGVQAELDEKIICLECWHWENTLMSRDTAIIDGVAYEINVEDIDDMFRGSDGKRFHISFHSGRKVVSHNVTCRGKVPARFNAKDNAVFI